MHHSTIHQQDIHTGTGTSRRALPPLSGGHRMAQACQIEWQRERSTNGPSSASTLATLSSSSTNDRRGWQTYTHRKRLTIIIMKVARHCSATRHLHTHTHFSSLLSSTTSKTTTPKPHPKREREREQEDNSPSPPPLSLSPLSANDSVCVLRGKERKGRRVRKSGRPLQPRRTPQGRIEMATATTTTTSKTARMATREDAMDLHQQQQE